MSEIVEVEFTVEKSAGVTGMKITVDIRGDIRGDSQVVTLINNKGKIELRTNTEYVLHWIFWGEAGNTLRIIGKITKATGNKEIVVEREKSEIPAGHTETAGAKYFSL